MAENGGALLRVREEAGVARRGWPLTRGVALPEGAVRDVGALWLEGEGGAAPAQLRALARWPDGSLKWVLVDWQADLAAGGEAEYRLRWDGGGGGAPAPAEAIEVSEGGACIEVCTGPLRFGVSKERFSLLEFAELGRRRQGVFAAEHSLLERGAGEAWATIAEGRSDGRIRRRLYGLGGTCRASLAAAGYSAAVEECGPLRVVLCCAGAYEAEAPMHHYGGYRPLRWRMRISAYAGQAFVRLLHTVVFAANPREVEVAELGLRLPLAAAAGAARYGLGARPHGGALAAGEAILLSQSRDDYFRVERFRGRARTALAEGERCRGWAGLERGGVGVGVVLRHMAEEYPKALGVDAGGIDVLLWRHPAGERLRYGRYAEEVAWHEGEGVYADGLGSAKSSEFFLHFHRAGEDVEGVARALLQWPRPDGPCQLQGMGGRAGGFAESEKMLAGFVEWMARTMERQRWYGYLDFGDVLATWEEEEASWRFRGRWGWCNSEWDPRHAAWLHYARTGAARFFELGEAMTRHSLDVDTCHYHPLRPYWVGGCYRHSLDHFGDEPCASHTFIDNWVDFYYLTGDGRAREVIAAAGEFFLRYRWSEEPRYSFSLRSIANVLRGLLHAYEVTGEARFLARAEEVYAVIARGQNADGSWHKRFQVSTPDRLPAQAPYGMATEGTTLAVEMGTAPSFSEAEYRALGGSFAALRKVLPHAEQKGYQTHYLLVGLELMHRLTGRDDVAAVYVRAVDWFCGGAGRFDVQFALSQHYHGILCGALAYAYQLTGRRGYLEVGRALLRHLRAAQDWSEDPDRRGAVAMSPTALSLLYWGVAPLLAALAAAGMEE